MKQPLASILRLATSACLVFWGLLPHDLNAQALDTPAQGFVSIEPFEIRQTFVVQLSSFAPGASGMIAPADHQKWFQQMEETLAGKCPLTVDGESAPLRLEHERSEFIRTDATLGIVTDDREQIPAAEAYLAIVFATSRPGFPNSASITWDLFVNDSTAVEVTFRSPGSKDRFTLTPEAPSATWTVPNTESLPTLEPLPPLTPLPKLAIPVASIVLGGLALISAIVLKGMSNKPPPAFSFLPLLLLAACVLTWKTARVEIIHPTQQPLPVTPEQADEITYALLINLYHAFDYRDESAIYDTLAESASGELLERVYLEISKSLTLEDQGGAKVRIQNVDLRRCIPTPLTDPPGTDTAESAIDPRAFRADCEWIAIGDVTHWAHTHTRLNRYSADLIIAPVDGHWRITDLEILEEFTEVKQQTPESE